MFDLVQRDIFDGYVLAVKRRSEYFGLATLTHHRDQIWLEITFNSPQIDSSKPILQIMNIPVLVVGI